MGPSKYYKLRTLLKYRDSKLVFLVKFAFYFLPNTHTKTYPFLYIEYLYYVLLGW